MSRTRRPTSSFVTATLLAAGVPLLAQTGPAPVPTHLDAGLIAQACSPTLMFERPVGSLLVTGGQYSATRHLYGPGDLITINGGSDNGIEVGQQYYVRRVQPPRGTGISRATPATIKTSGWVKVYAVDRTMSLVTVEHACDTMNVGDYLEPFSIPQPPSPDVNPPKPQRALRVVVDDLLEVLSRVEPALPHHRVGGALKQELVRRAVPGRDDGRLVATACRQPCHRDDGDQGAPAGA